MLDLEYGLPVQVRETALSINTPSSSPSPTPFSPPCTSLSRPRCACSTWNMACRCRCATRRSTLTPRTPSRIPPSLRSPPSFHFFLPIPSPGVHVGSRVQAAGAGAQHGAEHQHHGRHPAERRQPRVLCGGARPEGERTTAR
ncbi:unnamed protein product [Closterium sp. NIES-53]